MFRGFGGYSLTFHHHLGWPFPAETGRDEICPDQIKQNIWIKGTKVKWPFHLLFIMFSCLTKSHSANGPWKKSLNFIFPTKYVIPKSLKFSHWPSKKSKSKPSTHLGKHNNVPWKIVGLEDLLRFPFKKWSLFWESTRFVHCVKSCLVN